MNTFFSPRFLILLGFVFSNFFVFMLLFQTRGCVKRFLNIPYQLLDPNGYSISLKLRYALLMIKEFYTSVTPCFYYFLCLLIVSQLMLDKAFDVKDPALRTQLNAVLVCFLQYAK